MRSAPLFPFFILPLLALLFCLRRAMPLPFFAVLYAIASLGAVVSTTGCNPKKHAPSSACRLCWHRFCAEPSLLTDCPGRPAGSAAYSPPGGASTSAPSPTPAAKPGASGGGARGYSTQAAAAAPSTPKAQEPAAKKWRTRPEVQLLCLDMDGTLLDSRSRVLPSSVAAIKAAIARGVEVCLATGKARPAAMKAMEAVGLAGERGLGPTGMLLRDGWLHQLTLAFLCNSVFAAGRQYQLTLRACAPLPAAGEGLVVSKRGPGVFLQGLAAYGRNGKLIAAGELPVEVVREAFCFAGEHNGQAGSGGWLGLRGKGGCRGPVTGNLRGMLLQSMEGEGFVSAL